MGKGNRTRNNQYQDAYAMSGTGAAAAKRQPQKKDYTATIILIAIVALLALSLVLVLFADSGIKERNTVVLSSENYEVTGTMMSYYQNASLNNMYAYYINYLYNMLGDISYAYSYAQQMMSQYTLEDFFDTALTSAKESLVLCEAAKAAGVTLDAEDYASIDEAIKSIDGKYAENFGSGVKEKDVRKALELQALANKYYDIYEKEEKDSITDSEISTYIENNKENFYAVTALKFAFSLAADDYLDDELAFEDAKALADAYVAKLEEATTKEAFQSVIVEYIVERDFDSTVSAKVNEELLPDADLLNTYKTNILSSLISVLVSGNEKPDVMYKDGTQEKAMATVADTLESACATALASLETTQNYVKESEDETVNWLLNSETALNATKSVDSSNDTAYTRTVYMLTEGLHLVDGKTVSVGHILIDAAKSSATEAQLATAKAKAEELLATYLAGDKTKDAFETLAKANTADSGVFFDDVAEGDMVEEFNDWIFSEERGEIGETGIVQTDYGYHVMYWNGYGDNTSVLNAKNGIVNDRYTAFLEEGTKALTLNEKYIAKNTAATESETN